jgi:hypothetical protein
MAALFLRVTYQLIRQAGIKPSGVYVPPKKDWIH